MLSWYYLQIFFSSSSCNSCGSNDYYYCYYCCCCCCCSLWPIVTFQATDLYDLNPWCVAWLSGYCLASKGLRITSHHCLRTAPRHPSSSPTAKQPGKKVLGVIHTEARYAISYLSPVHSQQSNQIASLWKFRRMKWSLHTTYSIICTNVIFVRCSSLVVMWWATRKMIHWMMQ
jgi:hypothetical protein